MGERLRNRDRKFMLFQLAIIAVAFQGVAHAAARRSKAAPWMIAFFGMRLNTLFVGWQTRKSSSMQTISGVIIHIELRPRAIGSDNPCPQSLVHWSFLNWTESYVFVRSANTMMPAG